MTKDGLARKIATVVVVTCVAGVAVTVVALSVPAVKSRLGFEAGVEPEYRVGTVADVPPDLYATTAHTLILFASGNCSACQRSKEALGSLAADVSRRGNARVVLITDEKTRERELQFAREMGLEDSQVVSLDLSLLKVRRVPTILLVDRDGTVLVSHEGLLEESDNVEVVRPLGPGRPN